MLSREKWNDFDEDCPVSHREADSDGRKVEWIMSFFDFFGYWSVAVRLMPVLSAMVAAYAIIG